MRCVSDARSQPTSRVRPSPTSIQRRLLLGGRGTAMRIGHHPRAGDLAGKEGGRPEGSRALPPLPQLGEGSPPREPRRPRSKGGDGCGRPLTTHLASDDHRPRGCGAGVRYAGQPADPTWGGRASTSPPPSRLPNLAKWLSSGQGPLRRAPRPSRPSITDRGRCKGVGRGCQSPLAHTRGAEGRPGRPS